MAVRAVHAEDVHPFFDQLLRPLEIPHADRRTDPQPAPGVFGGQRISQVLVDILDRD
jgi:hypothetical protein